MSLRDISIMLDTRLNLIHGSLPVAWENVNFKPVINQPWIRPTLILGPSTTMDFNSHQENPGIYRVDIFYPLGFGQRDIIDKMDEIYTHFKSVDTLVLGTTIIYIRNISFLQLFIDEPWVMGSLEINYNNYEDSNGSFTPPIPQGAWVAIPNDITVEPNSLYISTNNASRVVFSLPAICNVGDYFRVAGFGAGGWRIQTSAGQFITFGDQQTSVGGYLESIDDRDCIELVCVVANTEWQELSSQGNITVV